MEQKKNDTKIRGEREELDTGFRVFRLEDGEKKPVSNLDMLFDIMLKLGLELSLPMETTGVEDATIYNVNRGELVAIFGPRLTHRMMGLLAMMNPQQIVLMPCCIVGDENEFVAQDLFTVLDCICGWDYEKFQRSIKMFDLNCPACGMYDKCRQSSEPDKDVKENENEHTREQDEKED